MSKYTLSRAALTALAAFACTGAMAQQPPPNKGRHQESITKDEYSQKATERASKRFDKMDADADGVLRREEYRAYREEVKRERKDRREYRKEERKGEKPKHRENLYGGPQ